MSLLQIQDSASKQSDNSENQSKIAIGIDLGTSNTVVTYYNEENEKVEILKIEGEGNLVPSLVSYNNKIVKVGKSALTGFSGVLFRSMKRYMGKQKEEIDLSYLEHKIDENSEHLKFYNGNNYLSVEEIISEILIYVKKRSSEILNTEITDAVITVPAYFDEAARLATKNAANIAKLNVLRLINEPTSAALAYGLDEGLEGIYIIYDFGGGTFDISVLKLQRGIFKVISTMGDLSLGGDNIDHAITKYVIEELKKHFSDINEEETKYQILETSKQIKERISSTINDFEIVHWGEKEIKITKEKYQEIASPIIDKTIEICKKALEDLNEEHKVQGVVLVGGSTRDSVVQAKVQEFFKVTPQCDINPDEVVAVGAGYQAASLTGKINKSVLLDVIPLSLGLEIGGGVVEKILHRNSSIPIAKAQEFTTSKDYQQSMLIHILQGERELVEDLRSLGKFTLKGIPLMKAGAPRIQVTFRVDSDGLLQVEALEKTTNTKQSIDIKPSWGLSLDDMRNIIEESMENAEVDIVKRLLSQTKYEALTVIETIEKAMQEDAELLESKEKEAINTNIANVKSFIESGSREEIEAKLKILEASTQKFAENRMNKAIKNSLQGKKVEDISSII